jgi:hypothetical protein
MRKRCGRKNMEAAGHVIMITIRTQRCDAMAASTVAGSLIYIRKGRRRENPVNEIESIFSI